MSRIRTIKPEFPTSEQVVNCTPLTRLTFILLWLFCDDQGVHPDSPRKVRLECFPGDADITDDTIRECLDELEREELIMRFEVDGKPYLWCTGFIRHQRIENPTDRFPAPPGVDTDSMRRDETEKRRKSRKPHSRRRPAAAAASAGNGAQLFETKSPNDRRCIGDASADDRRHIGDASAINRNGVESNRVDQESSRIESIGIESINQSGDDARTAPPPLPPPRAQRRRAAYAPGRDDVIDRLIDRFFDLREEVFGDYGFRRVVNIDAIARGAQQLLDEAGGDEEIAAAALATAMDNLDRGGKSGPSSPYFAHLTAAAALEKRLRASDRVH